MSEAKTIPLNKIRENPVALRSVNRTRTEYLELVESIRNVGVLSAISVREIKDPTNNDVVYGLIDGLHRYTASLDAGLDSIPCVVLKMDDAKVMEAQLIANIHRIETTPVEYSKHLHRILSGNPFMTMATLASLVNKSSTWLSERLGLLKLDESIQPLVNNGEINLPNAYALAKLPVEEQINFVDRAQTMQPAEFGPTVLARKKELDNARRKGVDAKPAEFQPVPHLQKISEIKQELESPAVGRALLQRKGLTSEDALAAWTLAIQWALHLDEVSIEAAKAKDAARKEEQKKKAAAAAAERAAKRAEEAQKAVAAMGNG